MLTIWKVLVNVKYISLILNKWIYDYCFTSLSCLYHINEHLNVKMHFIGWEIFLKVEDDVFSFNFQYMMKVCFCFKTKK